ncbi:hypothetical protein [Spirillospora sp. NPDC029432]|uniref:hypothetical protein n=1 Tax=Spirillospora sp. NPDC029432 TaxID=3154599 RepID=UPI003453EA48
MYVIRLPDGTLRVPHSVLAGSAEDTDEDADEGRIIAQAYVELRPGDPDYERFLDGSVTEEEMEDTRRRWRDEDAELGRVFEEWKAGRADE